MRNINGPWEKNSFGYHPLDRNKKKPEEWRKVKDKLDSRALEGRCPSPERDEFYRLSYAWHKTSSSLKFPAKMGGNSKQFLSEDEESELNQLITEDKNILLRHNARLAILYTSVSDESINNINSVGSRIVEKALKTIKSDGLRGDFPSVFLKHTTEAFVKASGIWENFDRALALKVLRDFKARGQYLYYEISYKGLEKEVRIRVLKDMSKTNAEEK